MSSKDGGSATTEVEPWENSQAYLKAIMGTGKDLYDAGGFTIDPYAGTRVAPQSATTLSAIDGMANVVGNDVTAGSEAALLDLLNTDRAYGEMDAIRAGVTDDVKSSLADMFAGGAINSDLAQGYAYDQMAQGLAGVEYDQYNTIRDQQLSALGMAPAVGTMNLTDLTAQLNAGSLTDAYNQLLIDSDMEKYYEGENADMAALQNYSALIAGIGGMGQTTTADGLESGDDIFSSAATGLGTYGTLLTAGLTNPYAAAGGVLAGLGSLF